MKCVNIRELLKSDYFDGECREEEARRIKEHLASCPDCRKLEEELRRQRALFRDSGRVQPPEQVWRNIREAIVNERLDEVDSVRSGVFERLRRLLWRPRPVFAITGTLTVVVLLAVFFSVLSFNRQYASLESGIQSLADYRVNGEADNPAYGLGTAVEEYFL